MNQEAGELRAELDRKAAERHAQPARAPARGGSGSLSLLLGAAGLTGGTLMLSRGGTEAAMLCFGAAAVLLIGGFRGNR
ncbi:hypothetical protein AB0J80_10070 [Actinoplanes sp. NPDC049548]|uniref:hypothetical protein n=1 Tax=Actinoplanes sp. NPDC049548 TaxID=3155152 RepID=UPI003441D096